MNKKKKLKNWIKEHKYEILGFTGVIVYTGIVYSKGKKAGIVKCDKAIKSLGKYKCQCTGGDYTIKDLGKFGEKSLTVPQLIPINEDTKLNAIMYFYDE